jgi:hypothetical protein
MLKLPMRHQSQSQSQSVALLPLWSPLKPRKRSGAVRVQATGTLPELLAVRAAAQKLLVQKVLGTVLG